MTIDNKKPEEKKSPTLQEILIPIWAERKRILLVSLAVGLVTLGINFLLPVYYKSAASLLPETQKDRLSGLGQFADIAQLAGVSVPGSEIARLYPTIINSETVLRSVILKKYKTARYQDSVNLIQYFEFSEKTHEEDVAKTLKSLRDLLSSSFDLKTSIVTLSVEMPEPALAADVLNTVIAEMDGFMRFKKLTNASEQVKWIQARLANLQRELRDAEVSLKDFKERNRRIEGSPELLLAQERLLRDVQVKSAVFIELKKQSELAKLEEIKNITIVNVLDPGRVPVRKERPKRATNAVIMTLVTACIALAFYAIREVYGKSVKTLLLSFRQHR